MTHATRFSRRLGRAFTLAELLIVMIIIVLLIGILLPALGAARRRAAKAATQAQLTSISTACESYTLSFNYAPGYFDSKDMINATITPNKSLLLSLCGGITKTNPGANAATITAPPASFTGFYVDRTAIGTGPSTTAGRQYGAFWTAKTSELADPGVVGGLTPVPDIVDGNNGTPLLYFRRKPGAFPGAPVVSAVAPATSVDAPFVVKEAASYTDVTLTTRSGSYNESALSLLSTANGQQAASLTWAITNKSLSTGANLLANSIPSGAFALISAGNDGVYFAKSQLTSPATSITAYDDLKKFDDVIVTGGPPYRRGFFMDPSSAALAGATGSHPRATSALLRFRRQRRELGGVLLEALFALLAAEVISLALVNQPRRLLVHLDVEAGEVRVLLADEALGMRAVARGNRLRRRATGEQGHQQHGERLQRGADRVNGHGWILRIG
jgi:type II secretory pathway pseudopilin PulG